MNGSTNADSGALTFGLYTTTSAAVGSFARIWANELKDRRIRVNTNIPGLTVTPGLNGTQPTEEKSAEFRDLLAGQVPMGRLADPDEIAAAVLFLACDRSSFITGSGLYADGGLNQT
ncbi:hypothetical protein GCM10022223_52340 [Kineosporia mesophila]|uniref:Uncharacterized protein n=1 Tax=Kineosporia mesophila TaxID=566012 RepID=A0ABP7ABN8_9ACTN|nr:SDR family oxidoreductase [Kineosporia mesophila]